MDRANAAKLVISCSRSGIDVPSTPTGGTFPHSGRRERAGIVLQRSSARHQTLSSLPTPHHGGSRVMADTASRPLTDRVVRITVEEVDRATLGQFSAELDAQEPGCYCLVVDLRDVAFIDAG